MDVSDLIKRCGGVAKLATALGIHHASVIGWRKANRIPVERAREIHERFGIALHDIRPDIWRPEDSPEPAIPFSDCPRDRAFAGDLTREAI